MGDASYSFSLTTFSPTGKLLQIEHALKAVQNGKTSLGIQGGYSGYLQVGVVQAWVMHNVVGHSLVIDHLHLCCSTDSNEWSCASNREETTIYLD